MHTEKSCMGMLVMTVSFLFVQRLLLDPVLILETFTLLHRDLQIFGNHLVLERPACSPAKLGHHSIAVSQEIDVEVQMIDRLVNVRVRVPTTGSGTLTSREM